MRSRVGHAPARAKWLIEFPVVRSLGGRHAQRPQSIRGTIKSVKIGNVMAEVIVLVDSIEIVSLISRTSAEHMNLKVGDEVSAVIKSTEVLIDK